MIPAYQPIRFQNPLTAPNCYISVKHRDLSIRFHPFHYRIFILEFKGLINSEKVKLKSGG